MKTQSIFFIFIFVIGAFFSANAQKHPAHLQKQEAIKVWGECDMCKQTIEKAAKKAGAFSAKWNTETKMLAVSYDMQRTNSDKIQQSIASSGYDTKNYVASNEAYNKLATCCKYERTADAQAKADKCCGSCDYCKS